MNLSLLEQSFYDERTRASLLGDSASRSGLFRIESGKRSVGSFSATDSADYYRITPGVGSFTLYVSADATNGFGYSVPAANFNVTVTDSLGNSLLTSTAYDATTRSISFTSPTSASYYVEIDNTAGAAFAYAATLTPPATAFRQPPIPSARCRRPC